jgi:heat shock protein HtpX
MAVKQRLAKREWWIHQGFTWMAFLALFVVTLIIFGFSARFFKLQGMILSVVSLSFLQILIWMFSRKIVTLLTKSSPAEGEVQGRLKRLLGDFLPSTNLKKAPSLYVSDMDGPNAFAFGSGLLGDQSVGVTSELLTMLDDEELKAVLAHECGHLAARDTTLMMLVSIMLTLCNQFVGKLKKIGGGAIVFMLLLQVMLYVPKLVSKGISQLREFGADCYSARMLGSGKPLISALSKLGSWRDSKSDNNPLRSRGPLDDLMMTHPRMEMRCLMLEKLEPPTGETAC